MTDEIEVILPPPVEIIVSYGPDTGTIWGDITGDLEDQLDLKAALDLKADLLDLDPIVASIATKADQDAFLNLQAEVTTKAEDSDLTDLEIVTYNELGCGVKSGGRITINADPTRIDIAACTGVITDNSNPLAPVLTKLSFPGVTGVLITGIVAANQSFIAIASNGDVIQQTTPFTAEQRRTYVILGAVIHSNRVSINVINNLPDVAIGPGSQLNDLIDGLKNFNISGNMLSANGANLSINKSEGYLFKKGANFGNTPLNPHVVQMPALTAPATLRYRLRNGTEYPNTAVVDPTKWDNNGVLAAVDNNKWTIQRFVLFASNLIRIQYGQAQYGSKSEAVQAISTEAFVEEQNMKDNGLLRGLLVVKKEATVLNNLTVAQFFEADRFGSSRFSGAGSPTSTLQQAYANSLQPQIVTDATRGAVQVKRGSASDTDAVFELLDGANGVRVLFLGNGQSAFGDVTGGNYSEFEPDGTLRFHGQATVFKDLNLSGLTLAPAGAAAPDLINFVNANLMAPAFDGGGTVERLFGSLEMQHDYKEGTDLEFHIHWTPATGAAGDVVWKVYYSWQNANGTFTAGTLLTAPASPTDATAWKNKYASVGVISGVGKTINSQLMLQIFRDPTDPNDTYGADAVLIQFGIHYEVDTVGSRARGTK